MIPKSSVIQMREGSAHNLPDSDSMQSAQEIYNMARKLNENDLFLVLVSGKHFFAAKQKILSEF